jgi:hypothetical protein
MFNQDSYINQLVQDSSSKRLEASSPHTDAWLEFRMNDQRIGGSDLASVEQRNVLFRRWRQLGLDQLNSIYMDNTTLHTAYSLVNSLGSGREISPVTLLDLATFVNSVVLYEHILHLENPSFDATPVNKLLGGDVIKTLPVESFDGGYTNSEPLRGISACLGNIFADSSAELMDILASENSPSSPYFDDLSAFKEGWKVVLNLNKEIDSSELIDRHEDFRWRSNGRELLTKLVEAQKDPYGCLHEAYYNAELFDYFSPPDTLSHFISECNHRSYFNIRVANLLNLSYSPSAARLPFREYQYVRATAVHKKIELMSMIEDEIREYRKSYQVPNSPNLELPVFLCVVLSRSDSLDSFFEVLAELRNSAKSFRRHKAEYESLLKSGRGGDKKLISLRKAIKDESDQWKKILIAPTTLGIAATLSVASGGTTALWIIAIGLLTACGSFTPEQRELVVRRFLKPEEWFLTKVGDTARAITDSLPDIARLWRVEDTMLNIYAKRFKEFSKLGYA